MGDVWVAPGRLLWDQTAMVAFGDGKIGLGSSEGRAEAARTRGCGRDGRESGGVFWVGYEEAVSGGSGKTM